jgi:hypothetical protein
MAGDMTGDAADGRALKAALGVGRRAGPSDCKRQGGATQQSFHWQISVTAVSIHGAGIRSRRLAPLQYC